MPDNLPANWAAHWAADPHREVLRAPGGLRLSGAEFADRTAALAGRYAAAGLTPGDRVLMSAAPSVDLVLAHVAALRYGLTVVPANTGYTAPELAHLVADARPVLAVLDDPSRAAGLPATTPDLATLPSGQSTVDGLDRAAAGDPALIVYTSGTTGTPKGAVLSHANLLASARSVGTAWHWHADDRLVLSLPLFHVHGLGVGLYGTLTAGASLVLLPAFDPGAVASAIAQHRGTLFFGVPTMYHRLAGAGRLDGLRPLRLAVSGSAPLPADLFAAVEAGSGQRVLERYGMTETGMLASNPYEGERRPGTVGFPLPGVELRLAPCRSEVDGGVTEVEVRGPNVFAGYLGRPPGDTFTEDGWLRTGDLGGRDADGYLCLRGRARELIISGGYNVYPREVEEALRAHPAVADAAVAGVPSAEWGERVVAYVVPAGTGDGLAAELDGWCAQRLAPYKRPREWRWIQSVPRNAMGKVLRHQLPDGAQP